MEIEVKASANLQDGQYKGIIDHIEYRSDPFEYVDVFIKEYTTGFVLKWGAPQNISEKTKLGKMIAKFVNFKVGDKINPEKVLNGKEVVFMTLMEKKDGNEYARIVDGSIKPAVTVENVVEGVRSRG